MNRLARRAVFVGASALPFARAARAQSRYPDKPIRLIIPWTAGGPADAGFRIMAQSVSKKLGQQVIVENKGAPRASWARWRCRTPSPMATSSRRCI